MSRALVISGGGSKGAFGLGVESIFKEKYDLYVGSSTGALLILLLASGKYRQGKKMYLEATNKSIYDKNPFTKKNKISKFKALLTIVKGKQSLSTTNKLLKSIRKLYTKKDHERILKRGIEVTVVVSNMTSRRAEYKSNKDYTWEEFTYWTWVSTLAYPFTSTVNYNNSEYADGGYTISLPIEYACLRYKNVKAIVLNTLEQSKDFDNKTIVQGFPSIISFIMSVNLRKDIHLGEHYNRHDNNIEFIYMPKKVTNQPMLFLPKKAKEMYEMGYNLTKNKYVR